MNTPEKRNKLPSAMQLHALFTYDPSTGFLWWKERPVSEFKNAHFCNIWNSTYAGKIAGGEIDGGYRGVCIARVEYKQHRIIYKMLHPDFDDLDEIDHDNGNTGDNREANLVPASRSKNMRNRRLSAANKSGVMGVFWCNTWKRWRAEIGIGGNRTKKKMCRTFEEAVAARKAFEVQYGYNPNHGRAA